MVRSSIKCGDVVESGLKRAGMLATGKYSLSHSDLITLIHRAQMEVIREHLEQDKESYYETRPVIVVLNGKFSSGKPSNTGTGTISATGTTITGVATAFLSELVVGDYVYSAGQLRIIATVPGDLSATVTVAFDNDIAAGTPFTYGNIASYDASTGRITYPDGMNPLPNANDIGKVITFFNGDLNPIQVAVGVINAFVLGTHRYHELEMMFPVNDIASATNITICEWLVTNNVIILTDGNVIMIPENIALYDVTNKQKIEMTSYQEFDYRKTLNDYTTSDARWARYRKSVIDIHSGDDASPLGTLRISAYFEPRKPGDFDSPLSVPDSRVPEVEERFVALLLSIREKTLIPKRDLSVFELQTARVADADTKEDQSEVR